MGTGTQLTSNEHLLQELEAISAVGIALASGRTDAEVLEVARRSLPSFVDSMRVSVNLTTADGKHITIHPLFGPPDVVPTIVELENMLVEQAIQTRELIEVPDVGARSEPDAVWASGIGVRAVVVAPLVAAGECFGCINFSRSEPGHYRRHEIVLIRHIAATLAPALLSSRSKARAESATQAKADFLAMMAHELRTPLHALLGTSELLASEETPEHLHPLIATVRESASFLASFVDSVFKFIDSQEGLTLRPTAFDVRRLVDDVAELIDDALNARALALITEVRLDRPVVLADRERLKQLLLSLLTYAINATERGDVSLQIRARADSPGLEGAVTDGGARLPAASLEEIFEPFPQLRAGTTRRDAGVGLSLAICKQLCAAMGGTLRAQSEVGKGNTIVFTVAAPPVEAREICPPRARSATLPFDVLVVDDSPVNRAVAAAMLRRLGFNCVLAGSGEEARARYHEHAFDLVLMDVNMPEEDGPSVARSLLAGPGPHATFVALTANTSSASKSACREAGMHCLVAKPLRLEDLQRLLLRVVPRSGPESARLLPEH